MQKKSIISKGKYSFVQAGNIVSVRQYFFVRDAKGQKRLLLRFFNDRDETCTGFAFAIRFLDSRGRVIDEEEYESGTISAEGKSTFAFEESIFVDERCCNFKLEVLNASFDNYKYVNEKGTVSVEYEKPSDETTQVVNPSKIKAPRKIKTRFFKLPMIYVWLALSVLTIAVVAMSVQLFVFKMTQDEFTLEGINYEFVTSDKDTGDVIITGHSGGHTNLLIPSEIEGHKVVGIRDNAFRDNTKIKKVRIEGVEIGDWAFFGCSNLTEVQIDSVDKIGEAAFKSCSKLSKVDVTSQNETVLEIGDGAFADCYALRDVSIDQFALYDQEYAIFENDYSIQTLHLKNFAHEIEGYEDVKQAKTVKELFTSYSQLMYDYNLKSLSIDYIDEITNRFCTDFKFLESFKIKETSIATVSSYAFDGCIRLSSVEFKSPVSKVEERAFANTAIESFNGTELSQIGDYAFEDCTSLEHFNLSGNDTLTRIGDFAFHNCLALESIVLPSSLTRICEGAFASSGLNSFTFSNSATTIEKGALADCANVQELNLAYIPKGYIGYLFGYSKSDLSEDSYELKAVRKVKIFGEKSTLDSYAFAYCSALQTVSLANSVTEIGSMAFYDCRVLAGVNLGENVEVIGESAFYNCKSLSEINLGEHVTSIGSYAFQASGIESITVPPTATVGVGILLDCPYIEEVTLPLGENGISYYFSPEWQQYNPPSTLKKININRGATVEMYAFYGCEGVEEISLCDGITDIYDYAFYECYQLRKLILPSTLETFASTSVEGCYKLYEICNPSPMVYLVAGDYETPYTLEVSTSVDDMAPTVRVGDCYFAKYQNDWYLVNWEKDTEKLAPAAEFTYGGETVTEWSIPHALFYRESSAIQEIKFPASVNEIGDFAFKYCESIMSIEFDKNATVAFVGDECFFECHYLVSVVLPNSIESIGEYAFANCYELNYVEMPSSLETINTRAFENCVSLTSIVLPSLLTEMEVNSFVGCSSLYDIYNLSEISIREGSDDYSSIARYGFVHTSLGAPMSTVVTIDGVGEFRNSGDKWLLTYLDHSLVTLDTNSLSYEGKSLGNIRILEEAARYRSELKNVTLGKNVIQVQDYAFDNCYNLRKLDMSSSRVTNIEPGAFGGCSRLIELSLPNGVLTISDNAFNYCSKLLSIQLPNGLESIGYNAFYGCEELFEVYDFSYDIEVLRDSSNGYVGYYAKKIITSSFAEPLERKIENGMYFVVADGIYYLHHMENVNQSILEIPNVGSSIVITPDAFYGCSARGTIVPKSVDKIDFFGNDICLQTVYYEGNYDEWNNIDYRNYSDPSVFYYNKCVHSYGDWTYKNGKPSTEYCDLNWSVDVSPTCQKEGLNVGRCACENGCSYKESYNLAIVDHKFENNACVYCGRKFVKVTSLNKNQYATQFEISTEKFEFDKEGMVTPADIEYGAQGGIIITAKQDIVVEFSMILNSYNDRFYLYRDYGYGYTYEEEIYAYGTTDRRVTLLAGESYRIVFINYTVPNENNEAPTSYIADIKILVK